MNKLISVITRIIFKKSAKSYLAKYNFDMNFEVSKTGH